jgi:hypothetical protein
MAGDLKERLARSRERREGVLRKFGFIPESILKVARGVVHRAMFVMQDEDPALRTTKDPDHAARAEARAAGVSFTKEIRSQATTGGQTLSVMPADLVDFFVRYYSGPGSVYLDPYMGQGIQLQVAHRNRMTYYGMDLSADHVRYIERVVERLPAGAPLYVRHGDSRDPSWIPDGVGDFSFNSPPYWDLELYGDDPRQIGREGVSYEAFLTGLEEIARAWLPKFRRGAYHVVNVNDLRRNGRFYLFHADVARAYAAAGWAPHDVWILANGMSGLNRLLATSRNVARIAPKVHEYALVFRRP